MDERLQAEFSQLMYAMTKTCARESWYDFLDGWGIDSEDYENIKRYLNEKYGVKTYV